MKKLTEEIMELILTAARREKAGYPGYVCYHFEIVENLLAPHHFFLRYIKLKVDSQEHDYAFCCFDVKGTELNCRPIFKSQQDKALFSFSFLQLLELDV